MYISRPANFLLVLLDYHRAGWQILTSNSNLSIRINAIHVVIPPMQDFLVFKKPAFWVQADLAVSL